MFGKKTPKTEDVQNATTQITFPGSRPYTFDRVVRMIITLCFVAGSIWLIDRLSGVLLPFLVAWLMAYMLEPFVQFNRRTFKLKGRFIAIILTLVETAVFFGLLGWLFIPGIIDEVHQMAIMMQRYADSHNTSIAFIPDSVHDFLRETIDLKALASELSRQDVESILKGALNLVTNSIDFIVETLSWLIVFLYLIFIMIDYDRLLDGFKHLVPPKYRPTTYAIVADVQYSMNHYFRGQALVSLCVGIGFAIGFYIIGLPMAIVLGLFIGLLNMVPYLQLISFVPTTILCIVCAVNGGGNFWTIWWECMAVYCIVQVIQDLILTPKIMGKYMGLNPAVILLSLSIWGSLLGLIGLIIALPLTTLLLAYYNRYIIREDPAQKKTAAVIDSILKQPEP